MCIGIPMQVVSATEGRAWCAGRGERHELDTLLGGDQPPGTWVLAFNGVARRVLDAGEAAQTSAALDALEAALAGARDFDAFFSDLIEEERRRAATEGTKP
jgi:hydrogenase expression/formation protein HypC